MNTLLKYVCIFCLITTSCKSSKIITKTISPTKGEIVFEKISSIYNQDAYDKSIKAISNMLASSLKKQIIKERTENNEPIDTLLLYQMISMTENNMKSLIFDPTFNNKKTEYVIKIIDSQLVTFKKIDDKTLGDYMIINRNNRTFHYLAKVDSIKTYMHNSLLKYRSSENSIIEEYRNDKKLINNFNCFKVKLTEETILEDEMAKMKTIYEMYVTENIKLNYHPVVWQKSILDNYYPLEIKEKPEGIEGAETNYYLKKITIK